MDTLNWQVETAKEKPQDTIENLDLTEQEKEIFELIATESKTFDIILAQTGMEFGDLMVMLTNLEIKGYIKQSDGEKYMSTVNVG